MRARQALATTLVVLLTTPYSALASDAGGAVTGIVKSVSGETLANVDIDFVNLVTGASRTLRTDGVGALRGTLEIGSYSVDARGYAIVKGPHTVDFKDGEATTLDLTLQSQEPAPVAAGGSGAAAGASGHKTGNIVALALFSGALTAAVIRAATVDSSTEDRHRPSTGTPTR
jgi:hypothetical protein